MSFVVDVLQGAGKLNKENIVLKVNDLKRKLEDIKLEVQESLKNRYIDFLPQYKKLDKLICGIDGINKEYTVLSSQIEKEIKPQMVSSVVEFNDIVKDLKKIKELKVISLNICLLHQHLEEAKRSVSEYCYLNAVHRLLDFETVFKEIDKEYIKNIPVISPLRTDYIVTREDIIYRLENLWREKIVVTSSLEEKIQKVAIKLNKPEGDEEESLWALNLIKQLKQVLKEFGKKFLSVVCETILCKTVKVTPTSDSSTLTMRIITDHQAEPSEAFEVLTQCFKFLYDGYFRLPVTPSDSEEPLRSVMNEFGAVIGDEFCTLIVEKSLKMAIPKQSKHLDNFRNEISIAKGFCEFLQNIGFISCAENKLLHFIHDVDVLPLNKMAQDLLSRARALMQKNLHQTVTVGTESLPTAENVADVTSTQNGLSRATFMLPKCQVSESVAHLIRLLMDIKEEAKNIKHANSAKLYCVARNICELYCCVMPTYHKEEIENIPQQTAIFHNNCMYLAHHLCVMGTQYESEFQLPITMTFVDLVPEIRKLGVEAFLAQMRHQRQQLLQLLQEQQACVSVLVDEGAVSKSEKAIRQCLCQLQLLKKVWSEVLPIETYFKAVGTLFNTCLEEIILRISSMEDIAAEAAGQLDSIFAILLKQGPDLFKISSVDKRNSVHLYVRRWFKFQELQLILSANLREIVDRWASGKGPLANHFTAEEVKRLIRALFQNTERRAAALAKIR